MNKLAKQTEELNNKFQQIYQASEGEEGQEKEAEDDRPKLEMTILGDLHCTTDLISDSYDKTYYRYKFNPFFETIENVVKEADVALATVGTNFTEQDYTSGSKYNSPTEFADAVADIGVDIVNIGTDRANDYEKAGLAETKQYWKDKGITVVGDKLEESNIRYFESGEFKIALVSYLERGLIENAPEYIPVYQKETAEKEIQEAKQNSDFVIVFMHWSSINQSFASTEEINLADEIVSLGADMIIGNHSNYVHQMQVRQNSKGKNVFIAYSLGNYLLNTTDTHTQVDLVLKIELRKSKETGEVVLQQVDYVPIYAVDNGDKADPRFAYVNLRSEVESYTEIPEDENEYARYKQMKDALEWIEEVVVGG